MATASKPSRVNSHHIPTDNAAIVIGRIVTEISPCRTRGSATIDFTLGPPSCESAQHKTMNPKTVKYERGRGFVAKTDCEVGDFVFLPPDEKLD